MKIKNLFSLILFSLIIGGFAMVSCEGPAGPAGADGIDGTDGTNGVAGNAVCITCHNVATKTTINDAYNLSGHAAGHYVGYAGGRQDCARCHSHEGYVETQYTGMDTTASADGVPIPTGITCGTCHDFHETLDFENDGADYALRDNDPFTLMMYDHEVTIDFENNSNVCGYCHQPRTAYTYPLATDSFYIPHPYWGPHHGPHATILEGIGGYEVPGSEDYPTPGLAPHRTGGACVACHMHEGSDAAEGTHTWIPSVESCTGCHAGATDFDVNGVQTEIAGLIQDLEDALVTVGILEIVDGESHLVSGAYTAAQAGAFYNYASVVDDRSNGVHNPEYIKALLINSIESL